jgi:hypothetical protein
VKAGVRVPRADEQAEAVDAPEEEREVGWEAEWDGADRDRGPELQPQTRISASGVASSSRKKPTDVEMELSINERASRRTPLFLYFPHAEESLFATPSDKSDGSLFRKTRRVSVLGGVDFQSMPISSATS